MNGVTAGATACKSVVRFIIDTIALIPAPARTIRYIDWYAKEEIQEPPNADPVGLLAFDEAENDKVSDLSYGVGIIGFSGLNLAPRLRSGS